MRKVVGLLAAALVVGLPLAGCGSSSSSSTASTSPSVSAAPSVPSSSAAAATAVPTKVMVIAEENETYEHVLGGGKAPYLSSLAQQYATATNMNAGYPTYCPSLAAYLLMTSGTRDGVCDDKAPKAHLIKTDSVFQQVAKSGREWRDYAEAIPSPCYQYDSGDFLVRHAPATYYVNQRAQCATWAIPLGTFDGGALHDDLAAGTLPAYSFVSPDACDDMHGAPGCENGLIPAGDAWLHQWMQQIMAGPDYRTGRLLIFVTWDEGDSASNHIPFLMISPAISHKTITRPISQCTMLRTTQDVLRLPPLGCAAQATPLGPDVGMKLPS